MSDIVITLDIFDLDSVKNAAARLKTYYRSLDNKAKEVCEKLASIGEVRARAEFASASYDGTNDVKVEVRQISESSYVVEASGQAVLFIEFGSGMIGAGHPDPQGYGPGTWSDGPNGKGHWRDPNGWYYSHGLKSFGNRPAAAMYQAEQEIRQNVERVVREVFGHD